MRAAQILALDGPSGVQVGEVAEPVPGPGHVLIDVHAAGVTFPEVLMARGEYQMKPALPFVPGSQVAGVVRTAPEGSGFEAGQRVAALCGLGAFAEVAVSGADSVLAIPDTLSFVEAAALPVNAFTADFTLVQRARLTPGETVLVHGAAGGVGVATLQVAKVLGARTIAVVSSDEKAEVARRAGADEVVDVDGFKDRARELTGGKGVDIVVDPVGGDRFTDSLRCLAREGRLLVVGFAAGDIPTVKVNRLLLGNTSVVGAAWGEFVFATPGFVQEQWARLRPHVESGALVPVVGGTYPLEQAGEALSALAERRATGNLVLEVG